MKSRARLVACRQSAAISSNFQGLIYILSPFFLQKLISKKVSTDAETESTAIYILYL
jgi:hypothetical protein